MQPCLSLFQNPQGVPPALLANVRVHLDARNLSSLTMDGNQRVSSWQSIQTGVAMTQADTSKQPLYQATGLRGLPCLHWDVTDVLGTSVTGIASATALTCLLVVQPTFAGQADTQGLATVARISNVWFAGGLTGSFQGETFVFAATGAGGTQPRLGAAEGVFDWAAGEAFVCAFRVGASGSQLWKNHQSIPLTLTSGGVTAASNFAPAAMTTVHNTLEIMLGYDGKLGEYVLFDRELSLPEIYGIMDYLRARWRV